MKRQYGVLNKNLVGTGIALVGFMLLLFVLRLLPTEVQSQQATDAGRNIDILESRIKTFFATLVRENSNLALEELLRQSLLGSSNATASEKRSELQSEIDKLKENFGEIVSNGWERYETKQIGEDIISLRYILKYEQYPVIWTFTFYRKPTAATLPLGLTSSPWVLVVLEFDTNLR